MNRKDSLTEKDTQCVTPIEEDKLWQCNAKRKKRRSSRKYKTARVKFMGQQGKNM